MVLTRTGSDWTLNARADRLNLSATTNPITIRLQIGDDVGTKSLFFILTEKGNRKVFKYPAGKKDDADGDDVTPREGDCNDQDPTIFPGAPELCNTVDDNCNSKVDEVFDLGAACNSGIGACQRSGVKVCSLDESTTVCNATAGTPIAELCGNSVDDDCDGSIDEGFDVGAACVVGIGACERSGTNICTTDGTGTACNATPGSPTTEVCNNLDDNCNGQVDDGVGQPITCGVGACARTVSSCVNGQPSECVPGNPTAEVCENGIDEDCNGSDLICIVTLSITITGPANLSSTNQSLIAVTGTVDPTTTEVTCNGRLAGINANGFGGNVPLKEGSNIVTCVAKDANGNVGSIASRCRWIRHRRASASILPKMVLC